MIMVMVQWDIMIMTLATDVDDDNDGVDNASFITSDRSRQSLCNLWCEHAGSSEGVELMCNEIGWRQLRH